MYTNLNDWNENQNVIDNKYSFYAISLEYLEDPESDAIKFLSYF